MADTTPGVTEGRIRSVSAYWEAMALSINAFPPAFREDWFKTHWSKIRGMPLEDLNPEGQLWKRLLSAFKRGRWKPRKPFRLKVIEDLSPEFMRMIFRIVVADLIFLYMYHLLNQDETRQTEELLAESFGRLKHLDEELVTEVRNRIEETVSGVKTTRDRIHPEYVNKVATARPPDWDDDPGPLPESGTALVLYHFTSVERMKVISETGEGLSRGDVPTTGHGGYNAPWLTTDPSWDHQQWSEGAPIDKAAVRISVKIPEGHPLLKHWPDLVIGKEWREALATVHGRSGSSGFRMNDEDWYVFHGRIPTSWFHKVETKDRFIMGPTEGKWGVGQPLSQV